MHKVDRLDEARFAAKLVMGYRPDHKTVRMWIYQGINGVRLKAESGQISKFTTRSTARWVIEFIYAVNQLEAPSQAFELDPDFLPRRLDHVANEVVGRKLSRSTLLRWRNRGLNGVRLSVLEVGKLRLVTRRDFGQFLDAADFEVVERAFKEASCGADVDVDQLFSVFSETASDRQ